MKNPRFLASLGLGLSLLITTACDFVGDLKLGPTAPSTRPSEFRATGFVEDDGCHLPPPIAECRRLSDVRVEVMGWPGRAATTDASGRFDLGWLPSGGNYQLYSLSASRPGWATATGSIGLEYGSPIRMGQEPHVLYGWVYLDNGFPRPPASGARVEILDGANAGKVALTDNDGMFVFRDLVTSLEFHIQASKIGLVSATVHKWTGLTRNDYVIGFYLK